MKTIPPEVGTAVSALFWSVVRIEAILNALPAPELSDPTEIELREILQEAGKVAVHVAYNAFETLHECGIGNREHDAFEKMKAEPLKPTRQAA